MPIYEYLCADCQHRFEVKQRVNDPPVATCVRCGGPVDKMISAPAIMFKGSGWYVTDYSEKLKPPTSAEPSAAAPKDGAASGSTPPPSGTGGTGGSTPAAGSSSPSPAPSPSSSSSSSSGSSAS